MGSLKENLEFLNQARKLAQMGLNSRETSNQLKGENVSLNLNFNFNFNVCNDNQSDYQQVESAPV